MAIDRSDRKSVRFKGYGAKNLLKSFQIKVGL